jgi:hypothetical protein
VELGYADLKSLIIGSVDKVDDGTDKVITGGRLNVTAAMLGLESLLTTRGARPVVVPPTSPPPPPSSPPPSPAPPPPPLPLAAQPSVVMAVTPPVCGMSPLRSLNSATQSSSQGANKANLAIDGECRKRRVWQGSCSQTSECRGLLTWSPSMSVCQQERLPCFCQHQPQQPGSAALHSVLPPTVCRPLHPAAPFAGSQADPWWAVKLTSKKTVLAVSIQTTSECACTADLEGARIMVGNEPWTSAASAANYVACATISTGIVRGQRKTFTCKLRGGVAPSGRYIAIWRPSASKKTLTLCEVDAVFAPDVAPRNIKPAGRLRRLSAAVRAGQQQPQ